MNRFQQGFLGGTHRHKPRSRLGLAPILKANIHNVAKRNPNKAYCLQKQHEGQGRRERMGSALYNQGIATLKK